MNHTGSLEHQILVALAIAQTKGYLLTNDQLLGYLYGSEGQSTAREQAVRNALGRMRAEKVVFSGQTFDGTHREVHWLGNMDHNQVWKVDSK